MIPTFGMSLPPRLLGFDTKRLVIVFIIILAIAFVPYLLGLMWYAIGKAHVFSWYGGVETSNHSFWITWLIGLFHTLVVLAMVFFILIVSAFVVLVVLYVLKESILDGLVDLHRWLKN